MTFKSYNKYNYMSRKIENYVNKKIGIKKYRDKLLSNYYGSWLAIYAIIVFGSDDLDFRYFWILKILYLELLSSNAS